MNQKQIILVTGATGAQGGSVAKALLKSRKYAVRIFTGNRLSENAIALQQAGAEIAEGDPDDRESLRQAMKGVYGVFGVSGSGTHFEHEYQQGKNILDAVADSAIKHVVFSAMPQSGWKAPLKEYAKSLDLPATFVQPSFYYEHFFFLLPLQKDEDGNFFFGFPQQDVSFAACSVEDVGGVASTVFDHPAEYTGRTVRIVGEDIPCAGYAAIMADVLQRSVYFKYVPRDQYTAPGFHGVEELNDMIDIQGSYVPNRQIDLIESYGLNPAMQPFKAWMIKNKERFIKQYQMSLEEVIA